MGSRMKEEERIERVIRGLLKLPENRRCINCNSLGPQYVCTTFWTFVCINCSGIHREFTHRVKSVSMAKFTAEEVAALQAGANERAKAIYFKEWDFQRHPYPDSGNIHRLRECIKHVYVDRKYTGERSSVQLPKLRLLRQHEPGGKEESLESKMSNAFSFGSKSSNSEDRNVQEHSRQGSERYERKYSERSSPNLRSNERSFKYYYDERSPRYAKEYTRHNSLRRNPVKFEVVDDRFRDNEFGSRRIINLESKLRNLSPNGQQNVDASQSPVARSAGESHTKDVDGSREDQNIAVAPSSSRSSVDDNPPEPKENNPQSLIDLSTKSEASDVAVEPQTQPMSQSNENNWATFEASSAENTPQTPDTDTLKSSPAYKNQQTSQDTKANTLELLMSELSGPFYETTSGTSAVSSSDNHPPSENEENVSSIWNLPSNSVGNDALPDTSKSVTGVAQPSNGVLPQAEFYGRNDSFKISHGQQISNKQLSSSVSVSSSSTAQPPSPAVRVVAPNNQLSVAPSTQDHSSAFNELFSMNTSKPSQHTESEIGPQPVPVKNKSSSGRKELPMDLFTASYLSGPAPLAGCQDIRPHGMGISMQYRPNAVPFSAFPTAAKSTNPFDVTEGRTLVHATSLPCMENLQGAVPAISAPTGLKQASSLGPSGFMIPQSPSYASPMAPHSPFSYEIPTGAYFQQTHRNMQPSRPQRVGSFNNDRTLYGSLATTQQSAGRYMAAGTPNSVSKTGKNPFE